MPGRLVPRIADVALQQSQNPNILSSKSHHHV
jgi:hypothetical protein